MRTTDATAYVANDDNDVVATAAAVANCNANAKVVVANNADVVSAS